MTINNMTMTIFFLKFFFLHNSSRNSIKKFHFGQKNLKNLKNYYFIKFLGELCIVICQLSRHCHCQDIVIIKTLSLSRYCHCHYQDIVKTLSMWRYSHCQDIVIVMTLSLSRHCHCHDNGQSTWPISTNNLMHCSLLIVHMHSMCICFRLCPILKKILIKTNYLQTDFRESFPKRCLTFSGKRFHHNRKLK